MRLMRSFVLVFLFFLASSALAQQSEIEIEFLQPSENASFEKGQTVKVEVRVSFPAGSAEQQVWAFAATGPNEGTKTDLAKNAQGNFFAELRSGYEMPRELAFRVFASANTAEGLRFNADREIRIDFNPARISLDFSLIPAPPYYLGSVIEKIKIDAFYPDGSRVAAKNWERPSLVINSERKRLNLRDDANGASIADINYSIGISENFLRQGAGELRFELLDMMNDKFGNNAEQVEKEFKLNEAHPSLKLAIKNPPGNERLFQGIDLLFEIELTKAADIKNERVFLIDNRDFTDKRECPKLKEEAGKARFQCKERIPKMDEIRRIYYVAFATADIGEQKITVFETSENEIGNIAHLELVYPREREQVSLNNIENQIKTNFWYAQAAKLEGGSYNGKINGKPAKFVWSPKAKAYVAEFDLKGLGEGQHELEFSVEGIELENERVTINFVPASMFPNFGPPGEGAPDPVFIIILIVAVLAVFTFIVWLLVLRKKKEEKLGELKEEAAVLKEMLKRIEIDYYKRRLMESEYKSRALDFQTRLGKIIAKIKVKEAARTEKQAPEEKPS